MRRLVGNPAESRQGVVETSTLERMSYAGKKRLLSTAIAAAGVGAGAWAAAAALPAQVPAALRPLSRYATLRRAWGLLADFRFEQTDPDRFYGHLAQDTVGLITHVVEGAQAIGAFDPTAGTGIHGADTVHTQDADQRKPSASGTASTTPSATATTDPAATPRSHILAGQKILDVGGGPGYFGLAFKEAGAWYVPCEPDVGEMAAAGIELASSVRGSGLDLPFADNSFDITYSSNVAEHVPDPWRMADEMLRVTRPGGLVLYSYTVWLGPFGGHETGLWPHYVGGQFAADRYRRLQGKEPKNVWGESLFAVSCADGLKYAQLAGLEGRAEVLAAFPRYHPWWAWWMTKVPGLREFAVSNLVLVLRKV